MYSYTHKYHSVGHKNVLRFDTHCFNKYTFNLYTILLYINTVNRTKLCCYLIPERNELVFWFIPGYIVINFYKCL